MNRIKATIYTFSVILNLIYLIFVIISIWYLLFTICINILKGEKIIPLILILIIYIMTTYGIQILFNKIIKFVEIDSDELKKYFKIKFDILENKLIRNTKPNKENNYENNYNTVFNKTEIDNEAVLELATKDDFQFYFRINEQIEVFTNQGNSFNGTLSYIGEDYLKIMINNIETKIMYSSIIEIV